VKLVVGSLTTRPTVLEKPGQIIAERGLGNAAIDAAVAAARDELGALSNLYTPAAYKSQLLRSLLRDSLVRLREM